MAAARQQNAEEFGPGSDGPGWDRDWEECCVAHDMACWCGGSATERLTADHALEDCVAARAGRGWGRLMYLGIRAGRPSWMPFPWRWAYGWPWLGQP